MDGEIQITVIATGFGRREPRLGLIESKLRAVTPEEPAADGSDRQVPAWKRRPVEARPAAARFTETSRADSMEVPTFLRRQMD